MNPSPDLSPQEALTPAKALAPVPEPKTRPRGRQGPGKGRPRAGRDTPCPYCQKPVPKSELDGSYPFDGCEECYWRFFD